MEPWLERDEAILSLDKWEIINWSHKHGIVWPGCNTKFWMLVHYAVTLLPSADATEKMEARKFLKDRACDITDSGLVTLLGVLRLHPLLKLH